ncbi:MAG TPA: hypothetical protein PK072_07860, partial [Quisquiliibacterium sp.]|nr:hypothetical protein [Quisquiliibacterium sp.]
SIRPPEPVEADVRFERAVAEVAVAPAQAPAQASVQSSAQSSDDAPVFTPDADDPRFRSAAPSDVAEAGPASAPARTRASRTGGRSKGGRT